MATSEVFAEAVGAYFAGREGVKFAYGAPAPGGEGYVRDQVVKALNRIPWGT